MQVPSIARSILPDSVVFSVDTQLAITYVIDGGGFWCRFQQVTRLFRATQHTILGTNVMRQTILATLAFLLGPAAVDAAEIPNRIAWYGSLKAGLAEASRSQRPILLVSGAPHCHGVSGVW